MWYYIFDPSLWFKAARKNNGVWGAGGVCVCGGGGVEYFFQQELGGGVVKIVAYLMKL